MRIILSITALFALCLAGCDKAADDPTLYMRGRLFLTNTITQNTTNAPLANKVVYLSVNENDSLNFLYVDTTDANGYFAFNLLPSFDKDSFVLRYNDTIGRIKYTAKTKAAKGNQAIELHAFPDDKQNGFVVYIKDTLGGLVPNAKIRVYNSPVFANLDAPAGAKDSIYSDNSGRAFMLNIDAGTYYLNASKFIADTLIYQRLFKTVAVQQRGIVFIDSIALRRK